MDLTSLGATGYRADGKPEALLVLAHGAGAGQHHPFMTAVAKGFASRGIDVVTFDFPYMRERRKIPDKSPVLERSFVEVIKAAAGWSSATRCLIGGKSMGGRMATHLGAAHTEGVSGIVVFGYPLHPPGKPDQLRVAHLGAIAVPILIIQGERDAFGTPRELQPAIQTMTAKVTLHVVAKGDHSLSVSGRGRDEILNEVLDVAAGWICAGSDPFTP